MFESWKLTVHVISGVDNIESALDKVANEETNSPVQLGAPLISFTLVETHGSKARLAFGMSHAIYDGISRGHTFQLLTDIYNGSTPSVPNFGSFTVHTQSSKADSYDY